VAGTASNRRLYALVHRIRSGHAIVDPPHSYPAWRAWLVNSGVSIATGVFFAALLAHAWVGVRDVIIDYVHPEALRVCLLALLASAWPQREHG
jgi:succinate dehydrogenase hydrophobic membrane anchor protein